METSFSLKELRQVNINVLDEKEIIKCEEAFHAFDKNQSKKLEKEELKKVLEEMGQNPTDDEVMQMIYEVDQTGDGAIKDFMRIIAYQKSVQLKNDEEDICITINKTWHIQHQEEMKKKKNLLIKRNQFKYQKKNFHQLQMFKQSLQQAINKRNRYEWYQ